MFINLLYRIDKVTVSPNPISKTVITGSWIIKITPYTVYVAHQNHVSLNLLDNEEHNLTINSQIGAQFLSVQVTQIPNQQPLFTIRLNALDYTDMQDRLQSPINNVRGIVIKQVIFLVLDDLIFYYTIYYTRMSIHVSVKSSMMKLLKILCTRVERYFLHCQS